MCMYMCVMYMCLSGVMYIDKSDMFPLLKFIPNFIEL